VRDDFGLCYGQHHQLFIGKCNMYNLITISGIAKEVGKVQDYMESDCCGPFVKQTEDGWESRGEIYCGGDYTVLDYEAFMDVQEAAAIYARLTEVIENQFEFTDTRCLWKYQILDGKTGKEITTNFDYNYDNPNEVIQHHFYETSICVNSKQSGRSLS
jgi:hypothetical protein